MGVLNELKNRGLRDTLIAAVDGLTGFPQTINAVFPETEMQLCMVHMVRNSVKYISYKDRKAVTADLKEIYLTLFCGCRPRGPGPVCREMGRQISGYCQVLAEPLERGNSFYEIFPGGSQSDIRPTR
jgi:hypothetical protein